MLVTARERVIGALLIAAVISLSACVNAPDRPEPPGFTASAKGTLVVMTHFRGNSVDADGITADVGGKSESVAPGTPATFILPAGPYVVSLGGRAEHCSAESRDLQAIVAASTPDTLSVEITCIGGLAYVEKTGLAESQLRYLGEDGRTLSLTSGQGRRAILGWSPDGQRIIFSNDVSGHAHLYSVQRDGGGFTQLTTGTTEDGRPRFSPDGARIAYTARDVPTVSSSVVVMNADGSNAHTLPSAKPTSLDPAWSADGSQLFFSCSFNGGNLSLCASAPDGSGLRAIDVPAIDALYAECTSTSTCVPPAPQSWDVSPDGRKLSFMTMRSPSLALQRIWISAIDGSAAKVISPASEASFYAQWSPTSDWLVLGTYLEKPEPPFGVLVGSGIATVKADGSGYRMHSPSYYGNDDRAATISPDGALLAFENGNGIFVMNADGTRRQSLTAHGTMSQPTWNPKAKPGGPYARIGSAPDVHASLPLAGNQLRSIHAFSSLTAGSQ
jgi:Tol biopolymer transport system component